MSYKFSGRNKIDPIEPKCRKTIYNSREEAGEMIGYLMENRHVPAIRAYKCTVCGFWHLTHKSEK
jgi:hypothetical protein